MAFRQEVLRAVKAMSKIARKLTAKNWGLRRFSVEYVLRSFTVQCRQFKAEYWCLTSNTPRVYLKRKRAALKELTARLLRRQARSYKLNRLGPQGKQSSLVRDERRYQTVTLSRWTPDGSPATCGCSPLYVGQVNSESTFSAQLRWIVDYLSLCGACRELVKTYMTSPRDCGECCVDVDVEGRFVGDHLEEHAADPIAPIFWGKYKDSTLNEFIVAETSLQGALRLNSGANCNVC